MDTNTAQPQQPYQSPQAPASPQPLEPVQDSYADAYVPPASDNPPNDQPANDNQASDQPVPLVNMSEPNMTDPASSQDVRTNDDGQPMVEQAVPDQAPVDQTPIDDPAPAAPATPSEELADQNIFEMLGVTTGTPEQREQFLDELQQVIWEDFIEHDTKLLLTDAEQAELDKIMQAAPDKSLEQQEQVVVYLEKLIPDLEDIMLEKALQLKEEMARERLNALRELHRNDADKMVTVERAEQLMSQQQWRSASESLNSLS